MNDGRRRDGRRSGGGALGGAMGGGAIGGGATEDGGSAGGAGSGGDVRWDAAARHRSGRGRRSSRPGEPRRRHDRAGFRRRGAGGRKRRCGWRGGKRRWPGGGLRLSRQRRVAARWRAAARAPRSGRRAQDDAGGRPPTRVFVGLFVGAWAAESGLPSMSPSGRKAPLIRRAGGSSRRGSSASACARLTGSTASGRNSASSSSTSPEARPFPSQFRSTARLRRTSSIPISDARSTLVSTRVAGELVPLAPLRAAPELPAGIGTRMAPE